MKTLLQLALAAIPVAATSSWLTLELSQEPAGQEPAQKHVSEMSEMEMMQAMMQAGQPGEQHKRLAKNAGEWDIKMSVRMAPDAPWQTSEGSSTIKMTMGGRYMVEQTKFNMMGMETQGLLCLGYDNTTKTYQSVWMDSWGTRMMYAEGKPAGDGVIVYKGTMKDFVTPKGRPYMFRVTEKDADHTLFEMYDAIPESPTAPMPKEANVMVMKMEYTRKS